MFKLKDAYIQAGDNGQKWTIGTGAVEQVYECRNGSFRLASLKNKLVSPALEYAAAQVPGSLFEPDAGVRLARFDFEPIWEAFFPKGETGCPMKPVRLHVRQGEILGFRVRRLEPETPSDCWWPISLEYEDQGPYENPGFEALDDGAMYAFAAGDFKKMADKLPGVVYFRFGNQRNLTRIWQAPREGWIRLGGCVISGAHGNLEAGVQRISHRRPPAACPSEGAWTVESGRAQEVAVGGRPAAQLDLNLHSPSLFLHLHLLAYPGTPIIRQWMELENRGAEPYLLKSPANLLWNLSAATSEPWLNYWMTGADSGPTQGLLKKAPVSPSYHNSLTGERTEQFVPWTALAHDTPAGDGLFVSSESLSAWNLSIIRHQESAVGLAVSMLSWADYRLLPGERIELPPLTTGVFAGGLDGMGTCLYDWQYQYLWDYTNPDYYARTQFLVPWFYCSRNLQEQFTARLAGLDLDGADHARSEGFDLLWDDAGWAQSPWPVPGNYSSVFHHQYEGPDFSQTQHYLRKSGTRWILWFCGRPAPEVMDVKIAAWGDFQWRTDAVGLFNPQSERRFLENIGRFLDRHPRSSFHTCDGGSRYAHTFGIQRLADVNMLADFRGDETNHYFSYLDTPDKWSDLCESIPDYRYKPETSRRMLTMVPCWYTKEGADPDAFRRDNELYHYLLQENVAGRWSYVFHPVVHGDREFYYFQRTSHDRTKALLILKHRAEGEVRIHPRGLLKEHPYVVGFDSSPRTTLRTGEDLMTNGIVLRDQRPGELVYLGLPDRPGIRAEGAQVPMPDRVFKRFETNLGHSGVGIHWAPAAGKDWISYYEIRRADKILGKASVGTFFFDHAAGWDLSASYSVRAVGGHGTRSDWRAAQSIEGEGLAFSALGGHFSEPGRDGWGAESRENGTLFKPMTWVPPARNPAADRDGGTPNQAGGVEGYWEGPGMARVGRGWQQASPQSACVRTWKAPRPGTIRVIGRVMKEFYRQGRGRDSLQASILHGTTQIWPEQGLAEIRLQDLEGKMHDLSLEVKRGEVLRFVLEPGPEPENDLVAWIPKIAYCDPTGSRPVYSTHRILCGATTDFIDRFGQVWSADRFFRGGEETRAAEEIAIAESACDDPRLYQGGREGREFAYSLPVQPGLYSIRLRFAEHATRWMFERPMQVSVNGRRVLDNFDICHIARGSRKACTRVFRYIVPDGQDLIHLSFSAGCDPLQTLEKAMVQAIEVLPEIRKPLRINCGAATPFVDWRSDLWSADERFEGGRTLASQAKVTHASPTLYDQPLYQSARSGRNFVYQIPVSEGLYTLQLKFAELWLKEIGKRRMNIEVNGIPVRKDWDPGQAAGALGMAADVRVEEVAPDARGLITISASATGEHEAVLQGIEIQ